MSDEDSFFVGEAEVYVCVCVGGGGSNLYFALSELSPITCYWQIWELWIFCNLNW